MANFYFIGAVNTPSETCGINEFVTLSKKPLLLPELAFLTTRPTGIACFGLAISEHVGGSVGIDCGMLLLWMDVMRWE